jgi:hypothetical protein
LIGQNYRDLRLLLTLILIKPFCAKAEFRSIYNVSWEGIPMNEHQHSIIPKLINADVAMFIINHLSAANFLRDPEPVHTAPDHAFASNIEF